MNINLLSYFVTTRCLCTWFWNLQQTVIFHMSYWQGIKRFSTMTMGTIEEKKLQAHYRIKVSFNVKDKNGSDIVKVLWVIYVTICISLLGSDSNSDLQLNKLACYANTWRLFLIWKQLWNDDQWIISCRSKWGDITDSQLLD